MAKLDHTLSSLTLLEEEPWFPFFGGIAWGDLADQR